MLRASKLMLACALAVSPAVLLGADKSSPAATVVQPFLQKYCLSCHGKDASEGGISFHDLRVVDPSNAHLWKQIWEQVTLKEMPPGDEEQQPDLLQRWRFSQWITQELDRAMKEHGGFRSHLHPSKGNHLDHALLFGELPKDLEPASSPARIWRIHPQEHLTRLNELIAREPAYDPQKPGVRTRGDHIPPNEEGEVKVYYGLDRVIGWVGGTAAYAAAITGFPPLLATEDARGLRNYPDLYSVNGAEATQIANVAEDILRFMANGPKAEPYQFADKVSDIDEKYKHESLRGLSQSLFYAKEPTHPITPVHDLMHEPGVSEKNLQAAVNYLFEALTCRPPSPEETAAYVQLAKIAIDDLGKEDGAILGLVPIFLSRDALFRPELVEYGNPDPHGRVMLQDHELALAINGAFSYIPPDESLRAALRDGRLRSREDVQREIERMLDDDQIRKPRILQFFREYFDYDRAGDVCKDAKALVNAGGDTNALAYYRTMHGSVANTDRLIEIVLAQDKNVLFELLTTDRIVYDKPRDARYLGEFVEIDRTNPKPVVTPTVDAGAKPAAKKGPAIPDTVRVADLPNGKIEHVRIAQVIKPPRTVRTLTTLPTDQRVGLLTHPAWLVSHTDAMDNHAIHRGRWVRERLLGGAVPEVPITVNAMLPDEPSATLRHRMRVTREEVCWKCHKKMDPLGLPFQIYNHIGLYRTQEQGQAIDASGEIIDSGDPTLDGPVSDALDMIQKLARSERVTQVFVRHAFRFWMGRNETLNDAPILQDAYRAYQQSGGSMKALLVSLLTSDAFLYRKRLVPAAAE